MNIAKLSRSMLIALLCAGLSGCGYTFQGSGTVLPPDVKKVYIPFVENQSTEAGLSTLLTEALRDRFERYGVVTVVEENSEADAVLKAKIIKVKRAAASVTSGTDRALQQDVSLTVAAELKRITGGLLWRNPSLQVTSAYGAASSAVVTSSSEFAYNTLGASDL
ncbi:MAG: hypothetical protein DCC75_02350, partial [Proteobacteria bacterium]